jgi:hypothetical protein
MDNLMRRRVAATLMLLTTGLTLLVAPAPARAARVGCGNRTSVLESHAWFPASQRFPFTYANGARPWISAQTNWVDGDEISFRGGRGSVWSGVWFTGENGPDGWDGWLPNDPRPWPAYANLYSLIGEFRDARTGHVVGTVFIGSRTIDCFKVPRSPSGAVTLDLLVNDYKLDDNTGWFAVVVELFKR